MKKVINSYTIIKVICISVITLISFSVKAQNYVLSTQSEPTIEEALDKFGFTEQKIIIASDTIVYYLTDYTSKPDKLVLFIQGTDPFPIFFYQFKNEQTRLIEWFKDDYKTLDFTYAYAIVAKPGLSGIFNQDEFSVPKKYNEYNYREYRVNQIRLTIEDIKQHHLKDPEKIIVYGHSEGAQIAAALARVDTNITHLGFWSGNVLNNFYEFTLFERIAALKGQQSDSAAHTHIEELIDWYKDIIENPNSTEIDDWGFTNRRWSSYEEAPINDLLKIDIPIYSVFATEDESTPIETAYLLPIQFIQHRKNNLTFKVCINYDHSYRERKNDQIIDSWSKVFGEFIEWTNKTKSNND
ncbi:alpha/beta hydrolase family protein [Maribellus maritimus]|uniref:hypothetical protein n=1 Tax=Maribellus maritimus TaxID=2870838 RepID=UPI001EEC1990|nr:hypothetical protein [Maribellus maritimus]MCG6188254.1 hypothetical protein [Maribellus maritimus]